MTEKAYMGLVRPGRFVSYYGARLFVPAGHFDEAHMLAGGEPEPNVLATFSRLVVPGDVVIDVGANIGTHSFALAAMVGAEGRVYAVEADVDNVAALRASVVESGTANIEILSVAAADRPGLIRAMSTMSSNSVFSERALDGVVKVAVTLPLDDVIADRIALIKLDIEGAELLALKGLARTIERSKPAIVSEFSPAYIETTLGRDRSEEFYGFFAERGYAGFHIEPDASLRPIADYPTMLEIQRSELRRMSWTHIDVLFVPREHPMVNASAARTDRGVGH